MFWALFDQTNMENFEITHPRFKITSETGKFLFAIYLITAVLVGINMLIAMMNSSFEYVAVSSAKTYLRKIYKLPASIVNELRFNLWKRLEFEQ